MIQAWIAGPFALALGCIAPRVALLVAVLSGLLVWTLVDLRSHPRNGFNPCDCASRDFDEHGRTLFRPATRPVDLPERLQSPDLTTE
ncbi:MAG: hypothetical protein R3C70_06985 [Geminicoccaceae bacterium]